MPSDAVFERQAHVLEIVAPSAGTAPRCRDDLIDRGFGGQTLQQFSDRQAGMMPAVTFHPDVVSADR